MVYLEFKLELRKNSEKHARSDHVEFIDEIEDATRHFTLRRLAQHERVVEELKSVGLNLYFTHKLHTENSSACSRMLTDWTNGSSAFAVRLINSTASL